MKIAFYTLGCKVNQYETEVLKSRFASEGFEIADPSEQADVYVVNSCTVTATGDKKTRQVLRKFHRQNPSAVVALTGCMPQAFPKTAEHLPEAQVITGSRNRAELVRLIKQALATGERIVSISEHEPGEAFEPMQTDQFSEKTRAFVKIEDGCDRYCAYCIIPTARGPVRSKPIAELCKEVEQLAQNGFQEVVLVGINLSSYGKECGLRLVDAVEAVCAVEGIARVRLGSLEPELLLEDDIRRLSAQPKFCPQFHLSLQSGCDATLKRMGRHYDTAFYWELTEKLRTVFPGCAITTDIMVGFPGETEEEFAQTLQFVRKVKFAQAHVFAYSIRPGTRAANFTDQIERKEKEQRSQQLIAVVTQTREDYLQQQVGTKQMILFETMDAQKRVFGHTERFVPVVVQAESDEVLQGQLKPVIIESVAQSQCIGKLPRQ